VVLANATELTQVPEIGIRDRIRDQSKNRKNEYGHEYWDIYPQRKRMQFGYKLLSEADRQTLKGIFRQVGNHTPIVVAFDVAESIFGDKEELMIYGRINGNWDAKQVFLSFFDIAFEVVEAI
jgi:hypothetical protein